jgi:hypothetical protein
MQLAQDAEKRIDKYGQQLLKSSRLFSDQLFDGYTALWCADALLKYVESADCTSFKFKHLAMALFSNGAPQEPQDGLLRYTTK